MKTAKTIFPLVAILTLGSVVACTKKPVVAPKAEQDAAAKAAAEEAARKKAEAEAEAKRKAEAEAEARRKAEAEAESARKAAAEAEAKKQAEFRRAAEAALKEINFAFDKSDIREADKAKLQAIAEFLKAFPQSRLMLEGHCDERGTVEYNLALGDRRAVAAQRYLVGLGVTEDRLKTISYGKEKPKVQGKDEESWLANRRCEFKLQ